MSDALACTQVPLLVHVRGRMVVVVPAVVSASVAVAQSYVTVSVQTTLYQNVSVPPAEGAVNGCAIGASPGNGPVLPTRAAYLPPCPPVTTVAVEATVHPERVPVSKSPLVIPDDAGAVTVSETFVECVADGAVPLTVRVYEPAAAVPAFTVSVDELPAVTLVGLSEALAPAGTPVTVSITVSATPL